MSPPTIGSLCSGLGGLDLAVEGHYRARLAWYAETDRGAAKVLARSWPKVPNVGDVTTAAWSEVEPVDILTAGYPCQPFAAAGSRKGADDERHLWPYVAGAVRVLGPRRVVLENVSDHLSLGFGDVLGDLATAGLHAEWCVLGASDVGAAHRRRRVFVLASDPNRPGPQGTEPTGRPLLPTGRGAGPAWGPYQGALDRWAAVVGRDAPNALDGARLSAAFVEWLMGFPAGWVDGLTYPQALRALGNAVVPHQAAAALAILEAGGP